MKSIGLEQHDGQEHVIFQNSYPDSKNRHIHPQGATLAKFHEDKKSTDDCCVIELSQIPEDYRDIPQRLLNPFKEAKSEESNKDRPILQYMKETVQQYDENPIITQLATKNYTYNQSRYHRRKEIDDSRPWLKGEPADKLTPLARLEKLQSYIDKLCEEKDNNPRNKVPYPYFIHKISQDTWGLSITCTDIFGIK